MIKASPFPQWIRPTVDECRYVTQVLADLHGKPVRTAVVDPLAEHCGGDGTVLVLDSLIRTILSQNTTDITSIRAFKSLKEKFPNWDSVLLAPNEDIEDAIRVGGLAAIKTDRIKVLLSTLKEERGSCCLEWMRRESVDSIKTYLSKFKGCGPKTISCVLLFCLHYAEFPVDTHVHHIAKALGWCPKNASREQAYEHLNLRVPDDVKYELHVLLVEHGKRCASCGKNGRGNAIKNCPLSDLKRGGGIPTKRSKAVSVNGGDVLVKREEEEEVKEEVEEDKGNESKSTVAIKEEEENVVGQKEATKNNSRDKKRKTRV